MIIQVIASKFIASKVPEEVEWITVVITIYTKISDKSRLNEYGP